MWPYDIIPENLKLFEFSLSGTFRRVFFQNTACLFLLNTWNADTTSSSLTAKAEQERVSRQCQIQTHFVAHWNLFLINGAGNQTAICSESSYKVDSTNEGKYSRVNGLIYI